MTNINWEFVKSLILTVIVGCLIIGILLLVLGKLTYLIDKQQTICEKSGGVIVQYECFESFMSMFRCEKVKTGTYCTYPNGTDWKIVYE